MRITANYNQPVRQTHFGTMTATNGAYNYMVKNLSPKKFNEVWQMGTEQLGEKPDIFLSLCRMRKFTNPEDTIPCLCAQVNGKVFREGEGLCTSAYGVVKKAVRHASKG